MRNFDRNTGYKNSGSSSYSRNDRREDRGDRYYSDDRNRNMPNKAFGNRNDYNKKPRRDYEEPRHSYQDRTGDRGNRSYNGGDRGFHDRSYRSNDYSKNERTFRNRSPATRSTRERDGHSDTRHTGGYRNNEGRQRNMSPQIRQRNDYKPASTNIKSRLALRSRIASSNNSRIIRTGVNKIMRRTDLRGGLVSKRSTNINRAKDYARKIRQARMKLNEGGSTSSTRLKSSIEVKSPKKDSDETPRKTEENEDDYLAIANDVDFDEGDVNDESETVDPEKKLSKEPAKDEGDEKKSSCAKPSTSRSRTRTQSKERVRKFERIEYSCIHCGKCSTSAQEYRSHLSGRRHLLAMREVSLRVRATLNRLRKVQRDRQLEIEARIKDVEDIQSKYCQVCKLNFRQSKEDHRESEDHKKISSFLKPYCKICRMKLISPMKYEIHRCHTDHIRRKLKAQEGSDDEFDMQEMDIGDFKTVDSIGNVDDGETNEDETENLNTSDTLVGNEFVEKIEAYYCSLCHDFAHDHRGNDADEKLIKDHCKTRRHINRYQDHKKNEERKVKAKVSIDAQKSPEKSVKQNGSDDVKNDNEVDRNADVNIDENTNEESKHSEDSKFNR
ncbi:hypothetical protein ACKWTF_013744 [Chironomus riparius]